MNEDKNCFIAEGFGEIRLNGFSEIKNEFYIYFPASINIPTIIVKRSEESLNRMKVEVGEDRIIRNAWVYREFTLRKVFGTEYAYVDGLKTYFPVIS